MAMLEKINELKNQTDLKEVKQLCEDAMSAISSSIYNGVTNEAKIEIERIALTNLFENLSKIEDKEVNEWVKNQKRLFTIKNLGIREAVNSLNETKELREVLDKFKDALDNGIHESRLYEQFISALSPFGYFPTVGNAIQAVEDRVNSYKTDVDIKKILETMKETRSNYLVPLIEDVVNNYLSNKNKQTKYQLTETLMKFTYDPFVRDIASLLTLDATELQLEYANASCDIDKVYSPVLYLRENEAVFSVNNVYYIKKGNNVSRLSQVDVMQLDEEYKALCETLSNDNIKVEKDGITIYYKNDKAFISEGILEINEKAVNESEFKHLVEVSDFSGNRDFFALVEFVNSNFNEIAEIDFVKRVYLKENANHAADVFKLRDNVFITTHNPEMGKSTFYRNVNPIQAKNIMMEHLRYDISSMVNSVLPDEEKIMAQINETKENYNTYISDLTAKIQDFKSKPFGKEINEQVVEALEEELNEVKSEYKDYLNHVEKYMRAPESIDEAITLNLDVDGKKYTIPIPQEDKVEEPSQEDETGTTVGSENIEDEPASAITFDDDDTELLGDTHTIPEDEIDLGVEDVEDEAEDAEAEAEEEKEDLEDEAEKEGDEIKIEDEIDIDDEDKDDLKIEDEEDEEKEKKKKKEKPLESAEGTNLKKSKFVNEEGDKDKKKKKKVYLKRKVHESKKEDLKKKLNESSKVNEESTWNGGISNMTTQKRKPQVTDNVIFNNQKGSIIGQTNDGDLIVQIQGSTHKTNPNNVNVIGAKVETVKPPFKFDKETQKLLFEQYVKCGIFMNNTPVKTSNCYVKYSDWQEASNEQPINVMVEGQKSLLPKEQIRIFEDANDFANLDNYVEGVVVDEATGDAIENVQINVVDYTEAIGDADPVRIIRGGNTPKPETDTIPKGMLRTLSI